MKIYNKKKIYLLNICQITINLQKIIMKLILKRFLLSYPLAIDDSDDADYFRDSSQSQSLFSVFPVFSVFSVFAVFAVFSIRKRIFSIIYGC